MDERKPMVGWYDPKQLLNTAGMTVVSTVIGENADPRLTNASLTVQRVYDYSRELERYDRGFIPSKGSERDEIWIDYVADTGDGWDSTAHIAYHVAAGSMPGGCGGPSRGEVLIFGGDEVYPTSSVKEYQSRLLNPYSEAAKAAGHAYQQVADRQKTDLKKSPHVFALPGNHDWYDSLNAFRYIFCAPYFVTDRLFAGGWRTRQHRSYFALKLPHDWWLFGVDLQLTHNIDWPQLEYFRCIVENELRDGKRVVDGPDFVKGSKVIICTPEPVWVAEEKYRRISNETPYDEQKLNLQYLEDMIRKKGSDVRIYLAGDWHHYMRFATDDDRYQKITAGGGGAFLHPTHDVTFDSIKEDGKPEFKFKSSYPTRARSQQLGYLNLFFIRWNLKFGMITAILYGIVIWLFHGSLKDTKVNDYRGAAIKTVQDLVEEPWILLIVAMLVAGLIFFTDSYSKLQKYIGGALHAFAHLVAVFFIGWASYFVYRTWVEGTWFYDKLGEAWAGALTTVGVSIIPSWIAGSIIMGLYLLISLQKYGRHANEAFSALKIKDYKNFLRLHVTKDGVEIFPLKIRKVPKWKGKPDANPTDPSHPALIEDSSIMVHK